MKFARKIFTIVVLASLFIICGTIFNLSLYLEAEQRVNFMSHYEMITSSLGRTLSEVEKNTEILMKNAAMIVQFKDSLNSNMSTEEFRTLATEIGVDHIFIIDKNGTFIKSTNEDPSEIPNLFSFSPKYRDLISGKSSLEKTPIIMPSPQPKPHKFLLVPSVDRNRMIEVGIRANFIAETLSKAMQGNPSVKRLTLYSPLGIPLAVLDNVNSPAITSITNLKFDENNKPSKQLETESEVVISSPVKVPEGSSTEGDIVSDPDKYVYTLTAKISKETLNKDISKIRQSLILVGTLCFASILIITWILCIRLKKRLDRMTKKLIQEYKSDHSSHARLENIDEIQFLSRAFESVSKRLVISQEKLTHAEKSEALANMIQMIIHDIRRPFTNLKIGMMMLEKAESTSSMKKTLAKIAPEINQSIASVEGLIADILEVGSPKAKISTQPVKVRHTIQSAISEVQKIYPHANISFETEFHHQNQVLIHEVKVQRALINIIDNAVQAMDQKGQIWIRTRELNDQVELCIGNSGSFISADKIPKLFDAFYTNGKKNGTGLGLAISKKIIQAHDGDIWCESSTCKKHPNGKVEFFMTLPVNSQMKNLAKAN